MPNSKCSTSTPHRRRRIFARLSILGAVHLIAACSYGDPCLRHTDCGSGFVCVEGKCEVDLGDNPADAALVSDAAVSTDGSVSDTSDGGTRDVTSEGDADESNTDDAAGPDALRDVRDEADGSRDALDVGAIDARVSTDSGTGGDVGADADSGISRDADAASDAADAAG
jgi:hypothetical protein